MSPRQKVIVTQLQIASVGLLIAGFGFVWKENLLLGFGLLILAYGLLRLFLLRSLVRSRPEDCASEDLDLNAFLPDDEEREQEKEEEWETAMEKWMSRHSSAAKTKTGTSPSSDSKHTLK